MNRGSTLVEVTFVLGLLGVLGYWAYNGIQGDLTFREKCSAKGGTAFISRENKLCLPPGAVIKMGTP